MDELNFLLPLKEFGPIGAVIGGVIYTVMKYGWPFSRNDGWQDALTTIAADAKSAAGHAKTAAEIGAANAQDLHDIKTSIAFLEGMAQGGRRR